LLFTDILFIIALPKEAVSCKSGLTLWSDEVNYKVKLSKSQCIKAQSQGLEYTNAYIFVRQLHSLVKHPIIFNYKANSLPIRSLLNLTDKKFRELTNSAIRYGLASYNGTTLTFLSNNQNKKRKSDIVSTTTPHKTFEQIIVRNYYYKQKAKVLSKENQTPLSRASQRDFDYSKQVAPQTKHKINYDITLSCRKLAQLLNRNSPSFGLNKRKEFEKDGFINLYSNKVTILKDQAISLIKTGCHNVRRNKETDTWYFILPHTFNLVRQRKQSYCKQGTTYTDTP